MSILRSMCCVYFGDNFNICLAISLFFVFICCLDILLSKSDDIVKIQSHVKNIWPLKIRNAKNLKSENIFSLADFWRYLCYLFEYLYIYYIQLMLRHSTFKSIVILIPHADCFQSYGPLNLITEKIYQIQKFRQMRAFGYILGCCLVIYIYLISV